MNEAEFVGVKNHKTQKKNDFFSQRLSINNWNYNNQQQKTCKSDNKSMNQLIITIVGLKKNETKRKWKQFFFFFEKIK